MSVATGAKAKEMLRWQHLCQQMSIEGKTLHLDTQIKRRKRSKKKYQTISYTKINVNTPLVVCEITLQKFLELCCLGLRKRKLPLFVLKIQGTLTCHIYPSLLLGESLVWNNHVPVRLCQHFLHCLFIPDRKANLPHFSIFLLRTLRKCAHLQ